MNFAQVARIIAGLILVVLPTLPDSEAVSADLSILNACRSSLELDSIQQWKDFIRVFKEHLNDDSGESRIPESCSKHRNELLDLENIISSDQVCDMSKIDAMIEYHKKYLQTSNWWPERKVMTRSFFTKYAVQVAYACKRNLARNLETAKAELKARSRVFEEAKDKLYKAEPSVRANVMLIEEQADDCASGNVKPKGQAELSLDEYREALMKLERAEDIMTFDRDECEKSRHRHTKVSLDKLDLFFKPALMCHQLSRYYAGSILSIARLANYGYLASDESIDAELSNNPTLRDWLIAVQICEPLLYMETKEIQSEFAVVDTCSNRVSAIESMVYEDDFEELDSSLLAELVSKSKSTKSQAQSLMRSALKSIAKANLSREIRSGAKKRSIFGKSLSMFALNSPSLSHISDPNEKTRTLNKFTVQLTGESEPVDPKQQFAARDKLSDRESFEILTELMGARKQHESTSDSNGIDGAVSMFDPVSTLVSFLTVMAIMLTFEWLFFVLMTVAARICHHLYFNFDNILTFPPKILSWSDADFARYNDKVEKMDEDDFFDYDELTQDEQEQRDLLKKVFGMQPPMLYRD